MAVPEPFRLCRGTRDGPCAVGRSAKRPRHSAPHLEHRFPDDNGRHRRHDNLALSLFLAGRRGSGGYAGQTGTHAAEVRAPSGAGGLRAHPRRYARRYGFFEHYCHRHYHHHGGDAARQRGDRYRKLGTGRRGLEARRRRVRVPDFYSRNHWHGSARGAGAGRVCRLCTRRRAALAGRLDRQPKEAAAFYVSIAIATLIGIGLNFTPINPIKALYWSAVINGIVAVPVMVLLMLMTANRSIMGDFTIGGWLRALGWLSTAAMAACVVGMLLTWLG